MRAQATPLRGAADWPGALRVANAEKLIAPLLLAAVRAEGTMTKVAA